MDLFSGSFGCSNRVGRNGDSDPQNRRETNAKIKIWVLKCSRTGFVHYLEAYKDFVDLLIGFLMLRTGALIKLNREVSPVMKLVKTGVNGVYDSFEKLEDSVVIVDKDILLDPFEKLRVSEELQSLNSDDFECCNEDCFKYLAGSRQVCRNCSISSHFSCIICGRYFPEYAHTSLCYTPWKPWRNHMTAAPILTRYTVIQSSSQIARKPKKEGYVKKNIPFIITNDLNITPFSTSSVAEVLKTCGAGSCEDLECNELSIGTSEVLVMVGAALTSSTPLTDIFGKMCNNRTRVFSSASFSKFPPCHEHDRDSSIMRHPADRNRAAKNEKALRNKSPRLLLIPERIQEKTDAPEPIDRIQEKTNAPERNEGVVKSLSLMAKQLQEQISEQISNMSVQQQQNAAERVAPESQPNCFCPSCRKQQPKPTPEQLPFEERPVAEEPQDRASFSGGSSQTRKKQQPEQKILKQFSFQQQPASYEASLDLKPNSLGVCSLCPKLQQKDLEAPDKLSFEEHSVDEKEPEDKPRFSLREKQQPEHISAQSSFEPPPASDEASLEPQPNSLCGCSSCRRQQTDKKSHKLSFQEPPLAEEVPEDQPGCSGGFYSRKDLLEQIPSQLSLQRHPASEREPQPKFNEHSVIEASNSENTPQQSGYLQPMEQTASIQQADRKQSVSESHELLCEHAFLSTTPYSRVTCHSSRVLQGVPHPSVRSNVQSINNPLYRETAPADVPSSRSPQPRIPPPPSPRIVDASLQFQPRPQPRNVTCVSHNATHAPNIVRRSYPLARDQPGRTSAQHPVHFGKNCAAHSHGVVGHFQSVSGAFEQGSPDRSEVQSTTSDGSDKSGFFN